MCILLLMWWDAIIVLRNSIIRMMSRLMQMNIRFYRFVDSLFFNFNVATLHAIYGFKHWNGFECNEIHFLVSEADFNKLKCQLLNFNEIQCEMSYDLIKPIKIQWWKGRHESILFGFVWVHLFAQQQIWSNWFSERIEPTLFIKWIRVYL